jgi:hypothetical protein
MTANNFKDLNQIQLAKMVAIENFEIIRSQEGDFYAVPKLGPKIPLRLGHRAFARALTAAFSKFTGGKRTLNSRSITEVELNLEGTVADSNPKTVHLRYATDREKTYVDLGDATGECVEVSDDGWRIVGRPPVIFKRTALTLPMIRPSQSEGDLMKIFKIVAIQPSHRSQFIAWLVSAFWPDIAHPILVLDGEQGSGKSKATSYPGLLIDPTSAPLRRMPESGDRWVDAVHGSYFVPLDNVSRLNEEMSNHLCRASTGDGEVRRTKYTDDDLKIFTFRKIIAMNGINILGIREDLSERIITCDLPVISPTARKTDSEIEGFFQEHGPSIMRGLLDLVVQVKRRLPHLVMDSLPRMADYAKILVAVDEELGMDGYAEYVHDLESRAMTAMAEEPFLILLEETLTGPFEGTSRSLLDRLNLTMRSSPHTYNTEEVPRKAIWVTNQLKRYAPALRKAGWKIQNLGSKNHEKIVRWRIDPPAKNSTGPEWFNIVRKAEIPIFPDF